GALLVLIHGTFVETVSTFGKLWALHPDRVRDLFKCYEGRVYALDHETLGKSPIANALTLVQARGEIGRIKALLRGWGEVVADLPDDQEIANPEDVAQQLRLLDAFRRRLAVQLRQAAQFAERDRPPHLAADIDDAREHIRQIKAQLHAWQAPVADTAEDAG
ncbi:MAG TPA: hypothetical protein PLO33_19705, partial [Kouleothrix sp.]|nr:hypothetical protein [Kouleothrix sp.]